MDTDFETEHGHRYTIGQFMKLNNGQVKLTSELQDIFGTYGMPDCCKEHPYNNRLNIRFYIPGDAEAAPKRKKMGLRRRDDAYSDNNILSELRHAFSSVVKGKGGTIHAVAKISQILIPPTMVKEVAKLFFDTIIQSPQQMKEYLHVLFNFNQPNNLERKIHFEFAKLVMETYKTPLILPRSPLESGADRTRRHRMTTCQLIASLFVYDFDPRHIPAHVKPAQIFSNVDKLRNKVIDPLVAEAQVNADVIKNLANVWGILKEKYADVLEDYKDKLRAIYKNTKFKLTTRIALKDYCDE